MGAYVAFLDISLCLTGSAAGLVAGAAGVLLRQPGARACRG
ncbi:hypothetical protein IWX58_002335 [Rubrivivax gelatinosus]|nr:hypothetical protein [Rubrivivax gelatinosus]